MAKRATGAKKSPKKKATKKKRESSSETAGQMVWPVDPNEETKPAAKDPWTPTKPTRRDY